MKLIAGRVGDEAVFDSPIDRVQDVDAGQVIGNVEAMIASVKARKNPV